MSRFPDAPDRRQYLDLPVDLLWDRDEPVVVFGRCPVAAFVHPFWDDVAQRRKKVTGIVPLDRLPPIAGRLPIVGGVHHMSRCGSTLIMRQVSACEGVLGVSEPRLIQKFLEGPPGALTQRVQRFRALLRHFCDALSPIADRLVFKWPMLAGLHAEFIAHATPEIRNIFLHRPGQEVLSSIQRNPLGGVELIRDHHLSPFPLPPPAEPLSRIASCIAHVCYRVCADSNLAAVSYASLPEIGWTNLPSHFGIEVSVRDVERIKDESVPHSKSVSIAPFTSPRPSALAESEAAAAIAARHIDPALDAALARITPLVPPEG